MTYQHRPIIRRILERLAAVVCPPEAIELGLTAAIVDHVALTMGSLPAPIRYGLVAGLITYDVSAVAWPPSRGHRSHALPLEVADRWLLRWEKGLTPVEREFAKGVSQLLKLACYEQPTMQAKIGYTPTAWIEKVTRRRLDMYRDDIHRAEAAVFAPDPLRPPVPKLGGRS